MSKVVVIILTFNSENILDRTIRAAANISSDIVIVDSGSTDETVKIAEALKCQIFARPFKNYGEQRNWAIREIGAKFDWQLHLDADEVLDDLAIHEIVAALKDPGPFFGFLLKRRTYFMNTALHRGGTSSWHLRLFRSGTTLCEDRKYDQHFICTGRTRRLRGLLHDVNVGNLSEWVTRHNRWSDAEVEELHRGKKDHANQLRPRLSGDPRERRRYYKGIYYRAPLILRPIGFFLYRYVIQLGFLDGRAGFLYAFFQALWFRMLIDAKLQERRAEPTPSSDRR
jgi:glycosyltransferase involved in cell wall biosynthesis